MNIKLIFGMDAVEDTRKAVSNDFESNTNDEGGNYNPYGKSYFNRNNMAGVADSTRITSIPSPYARMHITDLAFQELNCGLNILSRNQRDRRVISGDYSRALSHCLDVFEMMYRSNRLELCDMGITMDKVKLVGCRDIQAEDRFYPYIQTLELFRNEYLAEIRQKDEYGIYNFDFRSLYVFKYKGKVFAATSPLTGFFSKADCNITGEENLTRCDGTRMFTANPRDWCDMQGRAPEFRKFMYVLLKSEKLFTVFGNLFEAVKQCFEADEQGRLDALNFSETYPQFNVGNDTLQPLGVHNDNPVYYRPDGLDCSYLKYLLYLADPLDLTINPESYREKDITRRRFPDGSDNIVQWLGVKDILSDALFVLPYDINMHYLAVNYTDQDNQQCRRCLIPIKEEALNYFNIRELVDNMAIKYRKQDDSFLVSLRINFVNDGTTILHREYSDNGKDGFLVRQLDMDPFAFGIYPFVKSQEATNIYKVLFYNAFEADKYTFDLKFYDYTNGNKSPINPTAIVKNQTNRVDNNLYPANCIYYHVADGKKGIDLVQLVLKKPVEGNGEQAADEILANAFIAPCLNPVEVMPNEVDVAIDLGTSNTYVAYHVRTQREDINPEEILTIHVDTQGKTWNELVFMNENRRLNPTLDEKNKTDLILYREGEAEILEDWLTCQLCEFIPSSLSEREGNGYKFPIPSVINFLRINGGRTEIVGDVKPLVHCSIPFAYYEIGSRDGNGLGFYDEITDGSKFKWFVEKDNAGDFNTHPRYKACFRAFQAELLFIVRSHLLSKGYQLNQCRLLWSYPLSFDHTLVDTYTEAWREGYREYFNPDIANGDIDQYVLRTNESRSPIFHCMENPANAAHLTLLADIGGGSTDIIGYRQHVPAFISSFGFAGNALYLDSKLNSRGLIMDKTILKHYIETRCEATFASQSRLKKTSRIDKSAPISVLMNYGFSTNPMEFSAIFANDRPKFLLQFHNAALVYHIAQLCKIKSPEELPAVLYLTGNGSKLFDLNTEKIQMIKSIFTAVYDSSADEMIIERILEPKAATAFGALKGYERNDLLFNEEASENQVILLGDEKTCYKPKEGVAVISDDIREKYKEMVRQNVVKFIDLFYDKIYLAIRPAVTKEEVMAKLNYIDGDAKLTIGRTIADSLFFQYISLVMEQISIMLYKKATLR